MEFTLTASSPVPAPVCPSGSISVKRVPSGGVLVNVDLERLHPRAKYGLSHSGGGLLCERLSLDSDENGFVKRAFHSRASSIDASEVVPFCLADFLHPDYTFVPSSSSPAGVVCKQLLT